MVYGENFHLSKLEDHIENIIYSWQTNYSFHRDIRDIIEPLNTAFMQTFDVAAEFPLPPASHAPSSPSYAPGPVAVYSDDDTVSDDDTISDDDTVSDDHSISDYFPARIIS